MNYLKEEAHLQRVIKMVWVDILKFGPRQTPAQSIGSKQPIKVSEKKLPAPEPTKFIVSLTQQHRGSLYGKWMTLKESFDTRAKAREFLVDYMYKNRNPEPWTVEGDDISGHCVVYDGIMMSMGAPSYYYLIHEENEKKPDAASFNPNVDWTSAQALRDRFDGKYSTTVKRD